MDTVTLTIDGREVTVPVGTSELVRDRIRANAPNAEAMFQPDRIHPVAAAHPVMLANGHPVDPLLQLPKR